MSETISFRGIPRFRGAAKVGRAWKILDLVVFDLRVILDN